MAYRAIDVAHFIISHCSEKKRPVSNLKLQKMLYFTWIDYYKKTSRSLFFDDICAWQLGPVVPEVYYAFCPYAGMSISKHFDVRLLFDDEDAEIIAQIIDKYLPVPASKLVDSSHRKGGAWDIVYQDGAGNRDVIPFSLIKKIECNN